MLLLSEAARTGSVQAMKELMRHHQRQGAGPGAAGSARHSGLTYDALTDTYTYVWKTVKGWKGKCGTFTLELDDNSVHTADFEFK